MQKSQFKQVIAVVGIVGVLSSSASLTGCRTAAGTGTIIGGAVGAIVGNNSRIGTIGGALVGAIAGGILGRIVDYDRDRGHRYSVYHAREVPPFYYNRSLLRPGYRAELVRETVFHRGYYRVYDVYYIYDRNGYIHSKHIVIDSYEADADTQARLLSAEKVEDNIDLYAANSGLPADTVRALAEKIRPWVEMGGNPDISALVPGMSQKDVRSLARSGKISAELFNKIYEGLNSLSSQEDLTREQVQTFIDKVEAAI